MRRTKCKEDPTVLPFNVEENAVGFWSEEYRWQQRRVAALQKQSLPAEFIARLINWEYARRCIRNTEANHVLRQYDRTHPKPILNFPL